MALREVCGVEYFFHSRIYCGLIFHLKSEHISHAHCGKMSFSNCEILIIGIDADIACKNPITFVPIMTVLFYKTKKNVLMCKKEGSDRSTSHETTHYFVLLNGNLESFLL